MGERRVHENYVHVWFLAGGVAHATLGQVTAAELTAATGPLKITVDGLNTSPTNNNASLAMMDSGKIGQKPGTRQMDITLKFAREDNSGAASDEAWELFEYGLEGDLIVSRFGEAPATGDPVEVYRVQAHDPSPMATAQDTYQQFEVPCPADDWNIKAVMAA